MSGETRKERKRIRNESILEMVGAAQIEHKLTEDRLRGFGDITKMDSCSQP